jgi:chemotaxis regulatin CheY-phosphate phosphatase CheZ
MTNSEVADLTVTFDSAANGNTGMRQLLDMLRSLMPVLDNIKNAVENSSSKIPKATEQLSTVTQATENATMEILNLIDDIGRRIEEVQGKMQEAEAGLSKNAESMVRMNDLVATFTDEQRTLFAAVESDWSSLADLPKHVASIASARGNLSEIHSVSMNIAMALQVQDITSQQIESVRHQIESVRMQLSHVVGQYEGRMDESVPDVPIHKPFDGDASYTKDESRQADADSIIAQFAQQFNNH